MMEDFKKISIILPTFNGSKYLGQAIDSCLNQTYKNIELIIVNDGSTDNTQQIIQEYLEKDNRIISIHNETNKNLPNSLNIGFSKASGEFFTWTSDDNMYMPNAIEIMSNYLRKNSGYGLVYCDIQFIDANNNVLKQKSPINKPKYINMWNCVGPCFLFTRKVYETTGKYNADEVFVEDYEYWLRINKSFRLMKLDQVLYKHRLHKNSLFNRHTENIKEKMWYLRERFAPDQSFKNYLIAERYLQKKNITESKKYALKAVLSKPLNYFYIRLFLKLLFNKGIS